MENLPHHLPLIDKRSGELCKETEVSKISQQTFALVGKQNRHTKINNVDVKLSFESLSIHRTIHHLNFNQIEFC